LFLIYFNLIYLIHLYQVISRFYWNIWHILILFLLTISILLSMIIEINSSSWIRIIIINYLFFLFICLLIILNSSINTRSFSWVLILFKYLLHSIFPSDKTWRPSYSIICIWNINHCRWISYLSYRMYSCSIWINSFNTWVDCW
jgi:hypothetical protein